MHPTPARDTLFNMQKWILAVSPDHEFLEQISAHLQEGGRYLVVSATTAKEALSAAASQPFDLAILDAEISDHPLVPMARELTALLPNLRLLVYPPNNNPKHPALNGLIASGFLNKPFFGPEVISKITNLFKEMPRQQAVADMSEKTLPEMWVEDPNSGARQIEQLLGSTTATAGLLLLRGQVIAGSGTLSDESAGNIVNFLTRYWTNIQSGELFRYLRMNYETVTYLVYAVPLFKNVAIGLVYPPNASLDDVRLEVTLLRKGFLSLYTNTGELRHNFSVSQASLAGTPPTSIEDRPPQRAKTRPIPGDEPQEDENIEDQEDEEGPELGAEELSHIDALIADMPSPDPEEPSPATHPLSELDALDPVVLPVTETPPGFTPFDASVSDSEVLSEPLFTAEQPAPPPFPVEEKAEPSVSAAKTAPLPPLPEQPQNKPLTEESFPDFDFKLPWENEASSSMDVPVEAATQPAPPPLQVTQEPDLSTSIPTPPPLAESENLPAWFSDFVSQEPQAEDIQPDELLFRYNFILIPRNPDQFITRPFAEVLNQYLPQVHKENNWEFISISTRPQYLIWSAAFPLSVPVCEVAAEVRTVTNERLFSRFPELLDTHPNANFWATGFLAISGANSPSNQLVRDYIELTKQVSLRSTSY